MDLGGQPRRPAEELSLADWIWSAVWYGAAVAAVAGVGGIVRPLQRLHGRSRRRAAVMLVTGTAIILAIAIVTPAPQSSPGSRSHIDEFAPAFHFRERHETAVAAPPARVFEAIQSVSADEIALFNALTSIRRFGRSGPESILNAPTRQPILDVAVRSGFLLLHNQPPHEIVVGTVVVAPSGARPPAEFTVDDYRRLSAPGFATATMNFRVEEAGPGTSRVITETRVFATDGTALRRFTPYWRTIFPGSAILRLTWLRAIKTKAEGPRP